MTAELPDLRVRPADAYAALRVIADGARAAADVILEERVRPAAEATGASTFTTPFGKVFTATSEERVEILSSADLRAWLRENLPWDPSKDEWRAPSIVAEHQEDVFDEHQVRRVVALLSSWYREESAGDQVRTDKIARQVLRAALPPRTVPERIADWVIPYLTKRAKVVSHDVGMAAGVPYVIDSETGEEWPWATYVPEHVEWKARLSTESKAQAATTILEQITDLTRLVGVKEIES